LRKNSSGFTAKSLIIGMLLIPVNCYWVVSSESVYASGSPACYNEASSLGIFRNKLLWIGFAIAAGIDILNGLNYIYPAIPRIPGQPPLLIHRIRRGLQRCFVSPRLDQPPFIFVCRLYRRRSYPLYHTLGCSSSPDPIGHGSVA